MPTRNIWRVALTRRADGGHVIPPQRFTCNRSPPVCLNGCSRVHEDLRTGGLTRSRGTVKPFLFGSSKWSMNANRVRPPLQAAVLVRRFRRPTQIRKSVQSVRKFSISTNLLNLLNLWTIQGAIRTHLILDSLRRGVNGYVHFQRRFTGYGLGENFITVAPDSHFEIGDGPAGGHCHDHLGWRSGSA